MTARIDAHQHFWKLARGDYRWLGPELAPLYRDFGPQDLAPLRARHGIAGSVVVQAADTLAETEFLLKIAGNEPSVLGVVGWVELESRNAPDTLARLAQHPKFVGVRPMLQDLADERWILRESVAPALHALVELDLAFDALVKPRHLPHLVTLVERHPELRIVIDHGAKPDIAAGPGWSGFSAWVSHLRTLGRQPLLHCKLSGLATEARADWTPEDLRPHVDALLGAFGPERMMWGSDWPVVELGGGYDRWASVSHALVAPLNPAERLALFGATAAGFYGLELNTLP
ncbi:MAG: amidohydrolase family protein [Planctomycetaceae bacterium]|nr:amidohydrolase family protein [Planctomycetaceae bacterium]